MTLLPRSIPHECTGSRCYQCRAEMRRRILRQISSGFEMTAASMPAKPTFFPIASTFGVTRKTSWYSLQPATIYEVKRWPTTTARTWCCSLVPLVPLTGIGLSKWAIYTIRVVKNFPYRKPSQTRWVHPLRGHLGYGSTRYLLGNVGICVWYLLFYGGAVP